MGYYMVEKGQPGQALANYRQALEGYQELTTADAKDALAKEYLGKCYVSVGAVLRTQGKIKDGNQDIRAGVKVFDELNGADTGQTIYRLTQVATTYSNLGDAYLHSADRGETPDAVKVVDLREARAWYEKGLETWEKVKTKDSSVKSDMSELDRLHKQITKCDDALGQLNTQAKAQK